LAILQKLYFFLRKGASNYVELLILTIWGIFTLVENSFHGIPIIFLIITIVTCKCDNLEFGKCEKVTFNNHDDKSLPSCLWLVGFVFHPFAMEFISFVSK